VGNLQTALDPYVRLGLAKFPSPACSRTEGKTRAIGVILVVSVVALLSAAAAAAQETGPNGKIAFSSSADGDQDIYTMNPDGSELVNLTDAFGPWTDDDPNWSPDGSKIAFASGRGGGEGHVFANNVFVMNADGSDQVRLTFEPDHLSSVQPSWSPDGARLAFASDREGDWEIFTMNPDGSVQANITGPNQARPFDDKNPDWSPDGARIIFEGVREGAWEILVADPDGTNEVNLTAEDVPPFANVNGYASYRPDGTKIVFMRQANDGSNDWDIWLMDPDGTIKENIVPDEEHQDVAPTWSPDGNQIVFHSSRSEEGGTGRFDLFAIDYPFAAPFRQLTTDGPFRQLTTDGTSTNPDWGTSPTSVPAVPKCRGQAPTAIGTAGPDSFVGGPGVDVYRGLGGPDRITAGGGGDYVCSGGGQDTVRGEEGPDQLFGQADNDRLRGGDGDDVLAGGPGTDVCAGGTGADRPGGCEIVSGLP
jgi:Tol biopolymer transport system component